ncbi:MAG: methyl-accepting chemotaxis protein, partial [Pseudomonadota bacterium]
ANAVGGFRDNLKEVAELRKRQDEAASARERRSQAFEEAVSRFATRTNTQTTAMAEALGHLDVVSEQMNASNESLNQQSSGIAQASEASSSAVEGVAQATGHLGGSIKEIAASAANQRERAEHALSDIVRSSDFVAQLVESVRRVESVVELIGSIAEQTNLLALNATIESARAGEAGKGFAVVAAEIRELANQTAKATEEIEGLVEDIDARSTATSEANQTVHDHIKDMNRLAADVADAVQSQSMSSSDIIRSMNDAAQSARTITASIRDVADTTDMSLAAANKVTHAAVSLRNRIDEMQTSIDVMLKEVRAL